MMAVPGNEYRVLWRTRDVERTPWASGKVETGGASGIRLQVCGPLVSSALCPAASSPAVSVSLNWNKAREKQSGQLMSDALPWSNHYGLGESQALSGPTPCGEGKVLRKGGGVSGSLDSSKPLLLCFGQVADHGDRPVASNSVWSSQSPRKLIKL